MTPKQSLREQAKLISDQMWQFHNDRLSDPTTTDMTPYIKPILDDQQRAIVEARLEELSALLAPKGTFSTTSFALWVDKSIRDRITTLSNQIEGDTK